MIAHAHRFHGYGSLNSVYRQGQTVRVPQLNLRFAVRDPRKPYRVAVVVSRKVHKSAVVRNRIRRRIFEIVRQLDQQVPKVAPGQAATPPDTVARQAIRPGIDLIFTVFSDQIATMPAAELQTTIAELLRKTAQGEDS
jgi:ribonuclease P protein component